MNLWLGHFLIHFGGIVKNRCFRLGFNKKQAQNPFHALNRSIIMIGSRITM